MLENHPREITRADIEPQVKWVISLVNRNDHFNLPQEFLWVYWVNILTLLPLRIKTK